MDTLITLTYLLTYKPLPPPGTFTRGQSYRITQTYSTHDPYFTFIIDFEVRLYAVAS